MRTIVIYKDLYYDELSDDAKENAKRWYLNTQDSEDFADDCELQLSSLFQNSKLLVEYSLGYCQSDFFRIVGELNLKDVFENIRGKFSIKEQRFFEWAFSYIYYGDPIQHLSSLRFGYEHILELFTEDLEVNGVRDIRYDAIDKFEKLACDLFKDIVDRMTEDGYAFFYEISDEEMEETCAINEYEFDVDGNIA